MTTLALNEPFDVETSARSLGRNPPQRLGRRLWLPMLLMALMAFPVGLVLGFLRADEIADGGSAVTIEQLRHIGAGVMFIGFASVFAAISFATPASWASSVRAAATYRKPLAGRCRR